MIKGKTPTIKIFVSNRIDFRASQPECSLFVPVRCGAIFDQNDNSSIKGDDSGDNISDKRDSFNELTVLYWAWRNEEADYYGLCHYRRFLSFLSEGEEEPGVEHCEEHSNGCVCVDNLNDDVQKTMGLIKEKMEENISKYDAVFMRPIELKDFNLRSNYEALVNSPDYHFKKDVDLMMEIIKKRYPHMYETAYEYMHVAKHSYLYNCFVMKRELFHSFCDWLFDILFELEKNIDTSMYSAKQRRAIGTLGERLLGIYELWLEKKGKYTLYHTPLLFVKDSAQHDELKPAFPSEHNVAIASNFNDNYVGIFGVFLQSIIEHADPNKYYDFIIISEDISKVHKDLLCSMTSENMSMRFTSAKQFLGNLSTEVPDPEYSEDIYARIFIPHILSSYDKVLVVDADMISLEDISHVFETNLSQHTAAAVKDIVYGGFLNGAVGGTLEYTKMYMGMDDPYQYVNTGLLLFNAKKYREIFSIQFLQNFVKEHIKNVRIYEQDMLNMLLYGDIKFLELKWNLPTVSSDLVKRSLELTPWKNLDEFDKAIQQSAGVVHYAARPKPWVDVLADRSSLWWQYARKSPFYVEALQKLVDSRVKHLEEPDCARLRSEFVNIHFPNINNEFQHITARLHCLEKMQNSDHLRIIKRQYAKNKLKSYICFWNRRLYLKRCEDIKIILKSNKF